MARELTDIELDEVSICVEPANEECIAPIVKAKPQTRDAQILKETVMPQPHETELDDEVLDDGADGEFDYSDEELAAGAAEIEQLNEDGSLVPAYLSLLDHVEAAADTITKMASALEEGEEAYDELKKMAGVLVDKVEKAKRDGGFEDDSLLGDIRKSLDGVELSPEAERRLTAAEVFIKSAEDKEAIEKAKALGVGKAEELAPVLSRVRKGRTKPEDADYLEKLLKTNGAIIKSANLRAIGGAGGDVETSAIAKAKKAAEEIRKAEPKLSPHQAMDRALEQDPSLYEEVRAEERERARAR